MGHLAVEYKNTSGSWIEVWRQSGQQHSSSFSAWSSAVVQFVDAQQVRFVGVTGNGFNADAAVADVYLRLPTGGPNSLLQTASAVMISEGVRIETAFTGLDFALSRFHVQPFAPTAPPSTHHWPP